MIIWEIIFLASSFIILYNYAGYAIIAHLLTRKKNSSPGTAGIPQPPVPTVSFIVAAYNEESCIEEKAINSLAQDYPEEKIEFIFITDGSTDKTNELLFKFPKIKLLYQEQRLGKSAALNRAADHARNEILIFSDANTILNTAATSKIASHYQYKEVGGVAGEKKVYSNNQKNNETGSSEGLYWKYESLLKKIDSDFHSVVGAAGELFSVRKKLFEYLPESVILDDFVISLKIAQKGYRYIYEPGAYALELPSDTLKDEKKRKVRIAAGGFQAMYMLRSLLKFWKHSKLTYLYFSHRVLRWTLSPLCLILAFITNSILVYQLPQSIYSYIFILQLLFYSFAFIALFFPAHKNIPGIFKIPHYFVFMNIAVFLGFARFLRGRQPVTWEKAKRAEA